MTRFEILALLNRTPEGLTLKEIARNSPAPNWYTHAFHCAIRCQLLRLVNWGLVKVDKGWIDFHYLISSRGKERLAWALRTGKLNPH